MTVLRRSLNSDEQKPTYEQLELRVEALQRDLKEQAKELLQSREAHRRTSLVLRGMTEEHFHIRVNIDPLMLTQDAFEAIQSLLTSYVGRTVHALDEKLGGPLRDLQEALMHIHYLENHARSRGLQFTPFEVRACHKWLYY